MAPCCGWVTSPTRCLPPNDDGESTDAHRAHTVTGRALFVYWRIDATDLPATLVAVHAAQAQLASAWPGLQARLWQRSDPGVPATVMETYAAPGGIDAAAQARIDAAVAGHVPAQRHVEAFLPADGEIRG